MISLSIKVDTKEVERYLKRLAGPQGTRLAISRALNRAATSVRDKAAREIREKRNMPLGVIKKSLELRRASARNLEAVVIARGGPISIRHFANAGKRGVTAKVSRTSARVLLRRHGQKAFTNPAIGGGVTVFVRQGKKRLPIRAWPKVPGIASVFAQRRIEELMRTTAATVFQERVRHELRHVIESAKR